jgi:glycosyltransferase involved in cell wall biosynthesis
LLRRGYELDTLKILFSTSFYPPYHVGGDAVHVKYLAEELAREGHEVHVLHSLDAYQLKRNGFLFLKRESAPDNLFVHRIKSPLKRLDPLMVYVLGHSFYVQKRFSEILRSERPDVVHHHNISLLGYSILEKKDRYLSVYTAHDYWLICQTNNLLKKNRKICNSRQCYSCALNSRRLPQLWRGSRGLKRAVENIDLLISPSDYVRRRLMQEISVKSVTLPNFAPKPPIDVPASGFSDYFLFVGMLERHKGILNLLNLFKDFRCEIKSRLVIAGGGSLSKYVRDFIEGNSLGDKILFLGFVDDQKLYSLYSDALALVIPSIWPENAPLVALEALSVGTPVIVSNRGGLPEIVGKMNMHLVFDDFSQLKEILVNFSRRDFSSSEIKRFFKRNFSPQAYAKRYVELLKMMPR